MAYAEKSYGAECAVERSRPVIKGHLVDTRDTLVQTRDRLRSILSRLRGHGLPEGANSCISQPDPDHIVFIGEQTVQLSNEVMSLTGEIADYI